VVPLAFAHANGTSAAIAVSYQPPQLLLVYGEVVGHQHGKQSQNDDPKCHDKPSPLHHSAPADYPIMNKHQGNSTVKHYGGGQSQHF